MQAERKLLPALPEKEQEVEDQSDHGADIPRKTTCFQPAGHQHAEKGVIQENPQVFRQLVQNRCQHCLCIKSDDQVDIRCILLSSCQPDMHEPDDVHFNFFSTFVCKGIQFVLIRLSKIQKEYIFLNIKDRDSY